MNSKSTPLPGKWSRSKRTKLVHFMPDNQNDNITICGRRLKFPSSFLGYPKCEKCIRLMSKTKVWKFKAGWHLITHQNIFHYYGDENIPRLTYCGRVMDKNIEKVIDSTQKKGFCPCCLRHLDYIYYKKELQK